MNNMLSAPAIKLGVFLALMWVLGETTTATVVAVEDGDESGAPTNTDGLGDEFLSRRCTFAIEDEEEALARGEDASIPGSVVNVTDILYGRLGNHFATVYRFLALGYCCKSKLVTLPPKDPKLAPGFFAEGSAGPRHFDFSEAPDVPGFDTNACQDEYTLGGKEAYNAFHRNAWNGRSENEPLTACIEKSRVLECEAAYYFPTDIDICEKPHSAQENAGANLSAATKAEHLVVHVRSGDIFRLGDACGRYGQPPLSYYTAVLNSRQWDQVDILTYALSEKEQNPVLPELQVMIDTGSWPQTDVNIYMEREFEVDLRSMLCADALATSRSTLGGFTMYHTRARMVYFPSTCDGEGVGFGLTPKRLLDARAGRDENFEVIGIVLKPDAPPYKVYESHRDYDDTRQRLDMLRYKGIAGLAACS